MIFKTSNGIGYPSCNRALARIPRNRKDPHGYYAELGVEPWATHQEIRDALRRAYRTYHADGDFPDTRMFMRVKAIADTLLDPVKRQKYNTTPPGERLLDRVYEQELAEMPDMTVEILKSMLNPPAPERFFDFFADEQDDEDKDLAQEWYDNLVHVAPYAGFKGVIKVLLHNGDDPSYLPDSHIIQIPRHWIPSDTVAFALMRVFILGKRLAPQ